MCRTLETAPGTGYGQWKTHEMYWEKFNPCEQEWQLNSDIKPENPNKTQELT